MTEPHRLLSRTVAGLEIDNLSDECREWLLSGLRRVLAGDGDLDEILQLRPQQGKPTASTAARRDRRDGYICAIAFLLPGEIFDQAGQIADLLAGRSPDMPDYLVTELLMKIQEIDPSYEELEAEIVTAHDEFW